MGDHSDQHDEESRSEAGKRPLDENESAYRDALTETRRVINVQTEMVENTDDEILTIMRLIILVLGGVVTLIAYVPDIIAKALPWVILSAFHLVCSLLIAAFIYRGVTLYVGFGDHGHDEYIPSEKVSYEELLHQNEEHISLESDATESLSEKYLTALLDEHQSGISHNNIEIKYRSQIHQQVILLILISILIVGIGLVTAIGGANNYRTLVPSIVATVCVTAGGVYTLIKVTGLISVFIRTSADPNRLSYGYGFKREYPHLSRLCLFVTSYFYDPSDEDW